MCHQRPLSLRPPPFSFSSERICWRKSEEGEEHRARFVEGEWRSFWRMVIVFVKFAASTPTTNILRLQTHVRLQLQL